MNESIRYYDSPLGTILLTADETGLTGLWFVDEKTQSDLQISVLGNAFLDEAARWLDAYFAGEIPPSAPKLHLKGSAFQLLIWNYLDDIPYGKTVTYGDLAKRAAKDLGKAKMSAQAVGGAVGKNPVSLILPCHRVVGAGGRMVGYGGGLWRKEYLLKLEDRR
ncbi:MAG: methylated-DNA--[protein]-cysteine S-methyltransferase [Firmicutes bacterium]|nr:methylated-DNA--[protein]-cysteine S-methyltransferase [Bacillota bacterium]